ncbi:MAG TPA: trypsin-like peptidase domain-containing protein [Polyangiales bacterium]
MSIERILNNPALVDYITKRLTGERSEIPGADLVAERMQRARQAVHNGQEALLSREEEAIIRRVGRPVFLIVRDRISGKLGDYWQQRIEPARAHLERAIPAVGRIELRGHPRHDWVGTGWLIAPGVLATNRHVALAFGQSNADQFILDTDPAGRPISVSVDFVREHLHKRRRVFRIGRALHVEPVGAGRPDVALFSVEEQATEGPDELSDYIPLCEVDPAEGSVVGAIGYPARDGLRNDATAMAEVFGSVYDVKRFQPGEISAQKSTYFHHDCSTSGGASGSVLVDFTSGRAAGLHYVGYYEKTNYAVKASVLAELLHKLRIKAPERPAVSAPSAAKAGNGGDAPTSHAAPRVQPATATALASLLDLANEKPFALASAEGMTAEQTRELVALLGEARLVLESEELESSDLGSSPEHEVAARLQSWLHQNARHRAEVENLDGEVKFDNLDLRWGLSLLNWLRGLKKHPQLKPGEHVDTLPDRASVAIVGDWGSGLYGAPVVAASVERGGYDMAVHLGDVYYAGTEAEVRENFLQHWPTRPPMLSRALNSNHEMYSGGYGYFKLTLPALKQGGSYFAAQNQHYLIVGLDTGYRDFDLDDDQVTWLQRRIEAADKRRVILMSHHQLYKPGGKPSDKLAQRLEALLASRRIFAWYWGHEHAAVLFEQHARWGLYGRCIGHGGFPYFRHRGDEPIKLGQAESRWRVLPAANGTPAALLLDEPNPYIPTPARPERYGAQGYASLSLDGPRLTERLHRPDGTIIHEQVLVDA